MSGPCSPHHPAAHSVSQRRWRHGDAAGSNALGTTHWAAAEDWHPEGRITELLPPAGWNSHTWRPSNTINWNISTLAHFCRLCWQCCARVTAHGQSFVKLAVLFMSPPCWWRWSALCVSLPDRAGRRWTRTRSLSSCSLSSARWLLPCVMNPPTPTFSAQKSSLRSWLMLSGKKLAMTWLFTI